MKLNVWRIAMILTLLFVIDLLIFLIVIVTFSSHVTPSESLVLYM